jgi:hypothetical protein
MLKKITTITFALLALPVLSHSATLTVDLNGGADYTDIQTAIDAAKDGDTVLVEPGEYVVMEPIDFNRLHDPDDPASPPVKNIGVRSEGGAEVTTVRMALPTPVWKPILAATAADGAMEIRCISRPRTPIVSGIEIRRELG